MTKLLKKAFSEALKLPEQDQDAIAARWLEEIKDEQLWADKFTATIDEQWSKLADLAKQGTVE